MDHGFFDYVVPLMESVWSYYISRCGNDIAERWSISELDRGAIWEPFKSLAYSSPFWITPKTPLGTAAMHWGRKLGEPRPPVTSHVYTERSTIEFMADPVWPAGQWQDTHYRDHLANTLFHQLSTANVDESKLVEGILRLPSQYQEHGAFELGGTSARTGPIVCLSPSQAFGTNDEVFWPQPELAVPASQATQDQILSLASDPGQATPLGSGAQTLPVIVQSLRYQAPVGQNHPGAVTNPRLQSSQGNCSIPHALSQRQLSLGSFGLTLPLPVNNDATKMLQHTRIQRPSSKQQTSSNTAPRDVPRARRSKATTSNSIDIVSQSLLIQVNEEAATKMMSLNFEEGFFPTTDELTARAEEALDDVVARHADEGIKNWRSTDGEALINKLKGIITVLHREFAERIGNALTGFQLTFDTSESKEEMDLRRHAVVTTMLLDDSFLDGHLEFQINANESRTFCVPFAHLTIIDFMEHMLLRQHYSRFIPFHQDGKWQTCIRNTICFIAALCRSKMRQAVSIDVTPFPSQQDKDWYAAAIKDTRSFTGDKETGFNYFIRAVPSMLGVSNYGVLAQNSVE
ncbi:uncharacterized protein F5147DRAFT_656932 [Suillus discolor]|uniref:Uncharacterized protein n=1 Tax=Suillus discolor TaxID=1912936 RepID=A0A9P7JPD0_9AGAM|nr:uncharacterized protein F5147DRAFT_656932 [Suillus discolor]KAG2095286.1 hypothetical protein F5147DRAFT_656932 [Suillus discolor]